MVIQQIKLDILSLKDLKLPAVLGELAFESRGLVLVTGATGSGKSTTLAAMVDYRNSTKSGHIITIEDLLEFIHQHKKKYHNAARSGHGYQIVRRCFEKRTASNS